MVFAKPIQHCTINDLNYNGNFHEKVWKSSKGFVSISDQDLFVHKIVVN